METLPIWNWDVNIIWKERLGGGFKIFFIFIPTWGNDPIWLIFFQRVVQPPTRRKRTPNYPGWTWGTILLRMGSGNQPWFLCVSGGSFFILVEGGIFWCSGQHQKELGRNYLDPLLYPDSPGLAKKNQVMGHLIGPWFLWKSFPLFVWVSWPSSTHRNRRKAPKVWSSWRRSRCDRKSWHSQWMLHSQTWEPFPTRQSKHQPFLDLKWVNGCKLIWIREPQIPTQEKIL